MMILAAVDFFHPHSPPVCVESARSFLRRGIRAFNLGPEAAGKGISAGLVDCLAHVFRRKVTQSDQ